MIAFSLSNTTYKCKAQIKKKKPLYHFQLDFQCVSFFVRKRTSPNKSDDTVSVYIISIHQNP